MLFVAPHHHRLRLTDTDDRNPRAPERLDRGNRARVLDPEHDCSGRGLPLLELPGRHSLPS
jgi:hypothetical protein